MIVDESKLTVGQATRFASEAYKIIVEGQAKGRSGEHIMVHLEALARKKEEMDPIPPS